MKRLLAYLFIALGLGLMFNAVSKEKPIDIWNIEKKEPSQTQKMANGKEINNEFYKFKKMLIPLSQDGSWKLIGKKTQTIFTANLTWIYLAQTKNNQLSKLIEIVHISASTGSFNQPIDISWFKNFAYQQNGFNSCIHKNKNDKSLKLREKYYVYENSEKSKGCFFTRNMDIEKEIMYPDIRRKTLHIDTNHFPRIVKKYINNQVKFPKIMLRSDHYFFSNRELYGYFEMINPDVNGAPNTLFKLENKSEYYPLNINNYPKKKNFYLNWIKNQAKKHLKFETELKKNNQINLAKYINYEPTIVAKDSSEITQIIKKKVEVAKVEETKQEEFKPENKDIDNDAPIIDIAQNIIVDSQSYTLKGKVKDKSRFFLTIDDRPIKVGKNGKFKFEGFAIDSKEQLKIVAIDRWKNKSEKIINVEVKLKQVADLRSYEKPDPSKIKVKKDNNKIGIIIGIEKYQNLNNIDAPYANRDAKAFKAYANIALGIPSNNLKVLIDEDATRGELLKSLKIWLPQITRGQKKDIYIFFAGHGLASDNGEDLHILPHNGDPILLEDTALSRIEMFDLINKVNPKSVTMFFDTCYSGQTRSEQMLIAGLRPVRIVADEQETPNNFTIFTASDYDQTSGSINEAEHGIFSYYLMKGLEGKADENSDKKITNGELISYLKNNVTQEAFSQNRSQEPMLSGDPDKVLISYQ